MEQPKPKVKAMQLAIKFIKLGHKNVYVRMGALFIAHEAIEIINLLSDSEKSSEQLKYWTEVIEEIKSI